MTKFNQQTTPPVHQTPQQTYADRQFLHTFLAGALLPLVQASITAVMAGIGTLTLLYLVNAIDLLKPVLIVASVVWVLTWLYLQRRWLNLTSLEMLTGSDLNNDHVIGEPVKSVPQVVRIQIDQVEANGHIRQMKFMDLPISQNELSVLANGLLNGAPFSEREWTEIRRVFSSKEFRRLRSEMLKHDLLELRSDKDHRVGFDLTETGWALMRKFGSSQTSPPPESASSQMASQFEGSEVELTDEEMEAIEKENAAYAGKFQS